MFPSLRRNILHGLLARRNVNALVMNIAAYNNGAAYDYSRLDSLNQLSTGTTPVAVVTDPIGLSLDSRLGLVLGPELVSNGGPFTATTGWVAFQSTLAVVSGELQFTSTIAGLSQAYFTAPTVIGKYYEISLTVRCGTNPTDIQVAVYDGVAQTIIGIVTSSTATRVTGIVQALATNIDIKANGSTTEIGQTSFVISATVKLLDGNHALQATAAARPTWSNRVNLLTYTEQFDNAAWVKTAGVSVNANTHTDPDGLLTADSIIYDGSGAAGGYRIYQGLITSPTSPGQYTISVYLRADTAVTVRLSSNIDFATCNLTTVWQRFSITSTGNGVAAMQVMLYSPAGINDAFTIQASKAQHEYGSTATRYQRVTTATDFDTVGFPYYLSFLGTDDSLTSATGGGGSAGFFWCGVVQPTGGSGTNRVIINDYTGVSGYLVLLNTSDKLLFRAGNGATFTDKQSTATVNVGTKYLLTVWDDGTNLNVQINSAAAETVARPVVVAGTAGFTIGKDNTAASAYFIGNLYPSVYFKDTGLTAAQRAAAQAWVRSKAGL